MSFAPKEGAPGYIRVVVRGCGAVRDYWGEYDCTHAYPWACDECPWLHENRKSHYDDGTEPLLNGVSKAWQTNE